MATRRIGELLVAEGLISEAAISRALGYQRVSGDRVKLGSILLGWDLLHEESLLAGLGKLHRCPTVSWETLLATSVETARILSAAHAIRLGAMPYEAVKGLVRVAFINPSDIAGIDEVAALTGRRVAPAVANEARLLQAHQKFYGRHIPLEYRPILQKLARRSTTSIRTVVDFRQADLVETERSSTEVPRPAEIPDSLDASVARSIPVEAAPPEPAEHEISSDQPLALPEFPLPETPAMPAAPERMSLRSGDDSLTDWVGRALSSFTGDSRNDDEDPSPAGVADPSLFGRESSDATDVPGALDPFGDALPPTNAYRGRMSEGAATPVSADPHDLPSEAHSRGIPSSIPPFRRSTDPRVPLGPVSPLDREDDVVAGMWQHDPADFGAPEPGRDRPSNAAPPAGSSSRSSGGHEAAPAAPETSAASSASSNTSAEASGGPARSRDEIADSILQGSLEQLPRVLLLASGRTGITGWRGRGPGLNPEIVTSIRLPVSEISVFSSVQESGIPHFGAIDRAEWPGALAAIFGAAPPDCAVFPIRLLDGVAAFLYADRLGGPMQYEDFAIVARAAATAANVLSRFLLRSEKGERPSSSSTSTSTTSIRH